MSSLVGNPCTEEARKSYAMGILSTMKELNDTTYESWTTWKHNLELVMHVLGLEVALDQERPTNPTNTSSPVEKSKYDTWERGNRLGLLLIKNKVSPGIFSYLDLKTNSGTVKELVAAAEEMIMDSERMGLPRTLEKLVTMRYNGHGNVHEHLMEMASIANKLRVVGVGLPGYLVNQLLLDSLPPAFAPVQIQYPTTKDLEVSEIIERCWNFEKAIHELGNERDGDDHDHRSARGSSRRRNARCYLCGQRGHFAADCTADDGF